MKNKVFYVYILLINLIWLIGFSVGFASGHKLTLRNSNLQILTAIMVIILFATVILLQYKSKRQSIFKYAACFFLLLVLTILFYLFYQLISIGDNSYFRNLILYLILIFLIYYTCRFLFLIANKKV